MKWFFFIFISVLSINIQAEDKVLNVYNWSDYLPNHLIKQFEKETGITVNYAEFDNNETLYAKIKYTKHANYDVITPSSYLLERMSREGLLHPIDKKQLSNWQHLDPFFLNLSYDPKNQFSVPYLWSSVGIAINTRFHNPKNITKFADLWKDEYRDQLLVLDEWRDTFTVALLKQGDKINSLNPDTIKQAYRTLIDLMPNIRVFNSSAVANMFIDEDITIGLAWGGDTFLASRENPNILYIYPEEGFPISLDCLAIPQHAQHLKEAHQFINFLLRPEIIRQIPPLIGYATPNRTANQSLPEELRHNPIISPNPKILKRGKFQRDLSTANRVYEKYWERLKIGADSSAP
jgi:spermidine/putrescine transport system substrate-binding protein